MNTSEEIQTKNRQFRRKSSCIVALPGISSGSGAAQDSESKNLRTIDPYPENSQKGQLSGDLATSETVNPES